MKVGKPFGDFEGDQIRIDNRHLGRRPAFHQMFLIDGGDDGAPHDDAFRVHALGGVLREAHDVLHHRLAVADHVAHEPVDGIDAPEIGTAAAEKSAVAQIGHRLAMVGQQHVGMAEIRSHLE